MDREARVVVEIVRALHVQRVVADSTVIAAEIVEAIHLVNRITAATAAADKTHVQAMARVTKVHGAMTTSAAISRVTPRLVGRAASVAETRTPAIADLN